MDNVLSKVSSGKEMCYKIKYYYCYYYSVLDEGGNMIKQYWRKTILTALCNNRQEIGNSGGRVTGAGAGIWKLFPSRK